MIGSVRCVQERIKYLTLKRGPTRSEEAEAEEELASWLNSIAATPGANIGSASSGPTNAKGVGKNGHAPRSRRPLPPVRGQANDEADSDDEEEEPSQPSAARSNGRSLVQEVAETNGPPNGRKDSKAKSFKQVLNITATH